MNANHSTDAKGVTTLENESEDTFARPRFDAEAVRRARPAVPAPARAAPVWSKVFFIVALAAGLAGGILGSILTARYLSAEPAAAAQEKTLPEGNGRASTAAETVPRTAETGDNGKKEEVPQAAADSSSLETPIPPRDLSAEEAGETRDREDDRRQLRQAFDSWLEATNQRDINRQMEFYNSKINRYYRTRGASSEAVRAEKARVFGRADTVSVQAGEPSVTLSPDGNQATILFRKRYVIEGDGVERRGEVVQELRWQRVSGQWRIVGERDVKVVR